MIFRYLFPIIRGIPYSYFFIHYFHVTCYRDSYQISRILSKTRSRYCSFIATPSREWSYDTFYRIWNAANACISSWWATSVRNSYSWFTEMFSSRWYRWSRRQSSYYLFWNAWKLVTWGLFQKGTNSMDVGFSY